MSNATYTNKSGQKILVSIVKDHGMVNGPDGEQWNKVECRPIGLNNSIPMFIDRAKLSKGEG